MTDTSPQNEPQEPENPQDQDTAISKPRSAPLPTSVLVMGFVSLALFGALIGLTVKKSAKANGRANETQQAEESSPSNAQNEPQSADTIAERLKDDADALVAMNRNVKQVLADKQIEINARTNDWQEALKQQASLRQQSQTLSEQLNKALLANSSSSDLQNQLNAANTQIKSLLARTLDLQKSLVDVTAQRDEQLKKLKELRAQIVNSSIFASSESQMFHEAVALYRSLQGLENQPDSEIARAYSQFGANLGATVLDKIDFPTGSADLTPEVLVKIQSFAEKAPDNALLFVVGYASETGDVDQNRTLSSDRATNVAKSLENSIKGNQRVQAAYLGQTDRFGSKFQERNQICEVWQIVPKN